MAVEADAQRASSLQMVAQDPPARVMRMGAVVVEVVVQPDAARSRVDAVYVQEAGRLPSCPTRRVLHEDGRLVHGPVQRIVAVRVDQKRALFLQVEQVLEAVRRAARYVVRALEDVPQPLVVEAEFPQLGRHFGVGEERVEFVGIFVEEFEFCSLGLALNSRRGYPDAG